LPCRYVIHAVGPVWGEGGEDEKLREAVTGSLRTAAKLGLHSLALPAISTGIFGFPKDRAAEIIVRAADDFFRVETPLEIVRVTVIDQVTLDAFTRAFDRLKL
jgi:O-acetyl-ADP-ribose deacetylase (regulator of RNase III)